MAASTLQSAITLLARNAGVASQLLDLPGPVGLGLIVHLALRGPFAEAAFIRITPSRTLWATASQFDFPVIGFLLKLYL